MHILTVHLVYRLLTIFLITSKVLLISLPCLIFHMLEAFVFASFLCDTVTNSLPLKLNILDTPQGTLNT